ncbi:hypothetical protein O1611_g8895 [Lasiodiplodia mahajangana]|uniref:Uncharacterized protein n=1 Tax=Lasiodiplodia mahajangana TaxID=1108764 RepID=A0ACC2JB68_9PEZI|nr:hypothetical protein O1611_g8895 [Lasiodiplodia mahajangana]
MTKASKTDVHDLSRDGDGGLIWEQDPAKHRKVAKQMAPAFSAKATRAKDPTVQKYIDLLVEGMKGISNEPCGVSLLTWIRWLAMDIAAGMAHHHDVNCMRNGEPGPPHARPEESILTRHSATRKGFGLSQYHSQL